MRDAADQIQTEVIKLGDDLGRLRDRVVKLQKHFADANEDVRQILISADKIEKRAGRIEELDFSKTDAPEGRIWWQPVPRSCSRGSSRRGSEFLFVMCRARPGHCTIVFSDTKNVVIARARATAPHDELCGRVIAHRIC